MDGAGHDLSQDQRVPSVYVIKIVRDTCPQRMSLRQPTLKQQKRRQQANGRVGGINLDSTGCATQGKKQVLYCTAYGRRKGQVLTNFTLSGLDDARAVRTNETRRGLLFERVLDLRHVLLWDALRDAHH